MRTQKPAEERTTLSHLGEGHTYRQRTMSVWNDRDRVIDILCADVAFALAQEVDDFPTSDGDFRLAMRRAVIYVLARAERSQDTVMIFSEGVPGYTLLLFKKTLPPLKPSRSLNTKEPMAAETVAAAKVIDAYAQRTGNHVLVVETADVLFAFFPIKDLRRHLTQLVST